MSKKSRRPKPNPKNESISLHSLYSKTFETLSNSIYKNILDVYRPKDGRKYPWSKKKARPFENEKVSPNTLYSHPSEVTLTGDIIASAWQIPPIDQSILINQSHDSKYNPDISKNDLSSKPIPLEQLQNIENMKAAKKPSFFTNCYVPFIDDFYLDGYEEYEVFFCPFTNDFNLQSSLYIVDDFFVDYSQMSNCTKPVDIKKHGFKKRTRKQRPKGTSFQ